MDISTYFKFKKFHVLTGLLLLFTLQSALVKAQDNDPYMGIIPAPVSLQKMPGEFVFSKATQIKADKLDDKSLLFLKDFLSTDRHFNPKIVKYNRKAQFKGTTVILTSYGANDLPAEGYKLSITPHKITITGKGAGIFYGVQTLIQLFPIAVSTTEKLPCLAISDQPRFGYRGMMLDVSRHFFTVPQVKKVIDLLVLYKINNFHWHLVDGVGWRIEIKKYPKLTEIGGTRMMTAFGNNRDNLDGVPYTGFYTQAEIRDVVKYAAQRYINVVPEIEMPGHSDAALRAYPEFRCDTVAGVKAPRDVNGVYCPYDKTFDFLDDILSEVMDLFPSKYIHIGGDEVGKEPWKQSAFCQDLIKKEGLKDENELQSYFIKRIEKFINSKGRSIIGWDEILEGGVAPNATIMSWVGEEGGINAAKQHHNVIMTPQTTGLYFDHYQSRSALEPVSFGRFAVLAETYNYDPVSKQLSSDEQKYVIGTQGNLWTEYVPTVAKLQYQIMPRLFALSEVAWTKPENKDWRNFSEVRLAKHFARLDAMGYDYRVPTAFDVIDTMVIGSSFTYAPKTVVPGAKIYYTLNGRNPVDTDPIYSTPLTFVIPAGEKRELRTMVVSPSGRRSLPTRTFMYNEAPMKGDSTFSDAKPGLKYKLVKTRFISPEQLDFADKDESGEAKDLSTDQFRKDYRNFGVQYEGYISIPADGIYDFSLVSYDNSSLSIDGQKFADAQDAVSLLKGYHKIRINYISSADPNPRNRKPALKIYVVKPGTTDLKELSPDWLVH